MYSRNSPGADSPTGHPASPVTYTSDSALPPVTDEMLQGALQHIRPYTVCILKAGLSFQEPGPARESWVTDLIWEHGKRNYALYLAGDDIAFPITMALYFALGALGGLWIPLSVMPLAMQDIGRALPSNGVAELGWRIAGGQASVPRAVLVLTAWLLGCATAALLAYRRRSTRSAH